MDKKQIALLSNVSAIHDGIPFREITVTAKGRLWTIVVDRVDERNPFIVAIRRGKNNASDDMVEYVLDSMSILADMLIKADKILAGKDLTYIDFRRKHVDRVIARAVPAGYLRQVFNSEYSMVYKTVHKVFIYDCTVVYLNDSANVTIKVDNRKPFRYEIETKDNDKILSNIPSSLIDELRYFRSYVAAIVSCTVPPTVDGEIKIPLGSYSWYDIYQYKSVIDMLVTRIDDDDNLCITVESCKEVYRMFFDTPRSRNEIEGWSREKYDIRYEDLPIITAEHVIFTDADRKPWEPRFVPAFDTPYDFEIKQRAIMKNEQITILSHLNVEHEGNHFEEVIVSAKDRLWCIVVDITPASAVQIVAIRRGIKNTAPYNDYVADSIIALAHEYPGIDKVYVTGDLSYKDFALKQSQRDTAYVHDIKKPTMFNNVVNRIEDKTFIHSIDTKVIPNGKIITMKVDRRRPFQFSMVTEGDYTTIDTVSPSRKEYLFEYRCYLAVLTACYLTNNPEMKVKVHKNLCGWMVVPGFDVYELFLKTTPIKDNFLELDVASGKEAFRVLMDLAAPGRDFDSWKCRPINVDYEPLPIKTKSPVGTEGIGAQDGQPQQPRFQQPPSRFNPYMGPTQQQGPMHQHPQQGPMGFQPQPGPAQQGPMGFQPNPSPWPQHPQQGPFQQQQSPSGFNPYTGPAQQGPMGFQPQHPQQGPMQQQPHYPIPNTHRLSYTGQSKDLLSIGGLLGLTITEVRGNDYHFLKDGVVLIITLQSVFGEYQQPMPQMKVKERW